MRLSIYVDNIQLFLTLQVEGINVIDWRGFALNTMKELGLRKRHMRGKSGTHFLIRPSVAVKMVQASGIDRQSDVLEVGGGLGILSQAVLQVCGNLTIIEKNAKFIPILEEKARGATLIEGDALKVKWPASTHFISNLPYSVGSQIFVKALQKKFSTITVMLQKEVVDKIVAKPGTHNYGRISAIAQLMGKTKKIMDVPPEAFVPKPRVHSSVVRVDLEKKAEVNIDEFQLLTRNLFQLKNRTVRKVIRGYLKRSASEEVWEGVPAKEKRIFQLSVEELVEILEFLKEMQHFPLTGGRKNPDKGD